MKTAQKANSILKWIVLGLILFCITTYFMPIMQNEQNQVTYSYQWFTTLSIIPFLAIAFLFAEFKNNRVFFFAASGTFIINNIFSLIRLLENLENRYDTYTLLSGYYALCFGLTLLFATTICILVFTIIEKYAAKNNKKNSATSTTDKIEVLKERIRTLDELKTCGILTESEYEQKRSLIIKELQI